MKIRLFRSGCSRGKSGWRCASSNSCRSKRTAFGHRKLCLRSMRSSPACRSICRWRRLHTNAAKRRGDIASPMAWARLESLRRIRITSDGKLRTCLFSVWDHDLHELMRRGATDEKLTEFIVKVVEKKEERHHIGEPGFVPASRTMVHIGGEGLGVGRSSLVVRKGG